MRVWNNDEIDTCTYEYNAMNVLVWNVNNGSNIKQI